MRADFRWAFIQHFIITQHANILQEEPIDTDDSDDEETFILKQEIVSNLGRLGYVSDKIVATVLALDYGNSNPRITDDYHSDEDEDLAPGAKRQKMTASSPTTKDMSRPIRGRSRAKKDRSSFGRIKPLLTEDEVALITPGYWENRLKSFKKADPDAKPMPEGVKRPGKPIKKAIRMGDEEVRMVNEKRTREGARQIVPYKSKKRGGARAGPDVE